MFNISTSQSLVRCKFNFINSIKLFILKKFRFKKFIKSIRSRQIKYQPAFEPSKLTDLEQLEPLSNIGP
jgi:hypothetical protein